MKILIVEDEFFLRNILEKKLQAEGFDVILASDGVEAVEKTVKEVPDLILLDLILPKKNGFEVLEEIKKDPYLKDIPVIIISNLGQEIDIDRAKKFGVNEYLIKAQTSLDTVVEKIKEIKEIKNKI
jgi:two-component system alkaline phosphatase synthesis response regulator PhoP